jgi:hypothetical protein
MTTFADSVRAGKLPWQAIMIGFGAALLLSAVAIPNLLRSRMVANESSRMARLSALEPRDQYYGPTEYAKAKPEIVTQGSATLLKGIAAGQTLPDPAVGRKLVRTSAMEMVVQHPADVAEKITGLAEGMGGYLVSAEGGGQDATTGLLVIRVPAARFEEARAQIRKLGLRVESEKVDAQDVSRQYVDQDANLRNLRAEEEGYLLILKQAHSVKDMLAVSEKLSEVRGQIEEKQAEFNALSRQIETVAMTISLRTEVEPQAFGLNLRPAYQLRLALRDGLESLAAYATAMTTILFYLPAVLLWMGTIVTGTVLGWRTVTWVGRRWFGWNVNASSVQG